MVTTTTTSSIAFTIECKEKDEDGFHTQVDSKKFMIKDESGTTNMTKRVGGLCIGDEIG